MNQIGFNSQNSDTGSLTIEEHVDNGPDIGQNQGEGENPEQTKSERKKRPMTPRQCENSINRSKKSIERNNELLESLCSELEDEKDPEKKNTLTDRIGRVLQSIETSEKNIAEKTALKEQLITAEEGRREDIRNRAKKRLDRK